MIYLLVTNRGSHTFLDYLQDWAGDFGKKFRVLTYESFVNWPPEEFGTYIFSDLERLTDEQLSVFRDFADRVTELFPKAPIINHPKHTLRRLDLLKQLHASGINSFNAHRIQNVPPDVRFPVFLRLAREHNGPCSQLICDKNALTVAALGLAVAGITLDQLLAIEYCETVAPDGWYRKYSAFRFGDRIVAAHVVFSKTWVAKDGATGEKSLREEERAYIRSNPHSEFIKGIFDIARVQYGRIDYSMIGSVPQIWEINTNPILLKRRAVYELEAREEIPLKEELALAVNECLAELNSSGNSITSRKRRIRVAEFSDLLNWN